MFKDPEHEEDPNAVEELKTFPLSWKRDGSAGMGGGPWEPWHRALADPPKNPWRILEEESGTWVCVLDDTLAPVREAEWRGQRGDSWANSLGPIPGVCGEKMVDQVAVGQWHWPGVGEFQSYLLNSHGKAECGIWGIRTRNQE